MKDKKCRIFDFSKGTEIELPVSYYHYKNGQLDLELKIEVMSPAPVYKSNIIKFKKESSKKKKGSSGGLIEKPFNIA